MSSIILFTTGPTPMERIKKLFPILVFALMLPASLVVPPVQAQDNGDLVSTIQAQDNLTTLAEALTQTGLAETLQADGPYTVFAPTNAAFDEVDLSAMNADELASVLQAHVVSGAISANEAAEQGTLSTLEGSRLSVSDGMVNGTAAIETSLQAENGVVHIIDAVLSPSSGQSSY